MKSFAWVAFLVLFVAGTAGASTVDFTTATFSGALNQPSFSAAVDGNIITLTALPNGARLWWDQADGFGVQYGYENDEIEGVERLRIGFSTPVRLSRVFVTDLFNEGYLERGSYRLNQSGNWISFFALPGQTPSNSNGELTLLIDPSILVNSITFRAPGQLPLLNQRHEFSIAAIETAAPVPIPAAVWLLGSGLLGLVGLRRRFRK
jgi:hypothetical protein